SVQVPTSYDTFNAKDGTVQCKSPAGWSQNGGGGRKFISCLWESGSATIRVMADVKGSAVADIARSGGMGGIMGGDVGGMDLGGEAEISPVEVVHTNLTIPEAKDDLGEIEVKNTEEIETGFGTSVRSEFTASGTFGSSIHGYLVTALALNHRIRVICTCDEDDWSKIKPAFEEVIKSVKVGTPEM
ncbi:MAG: hypothetical protein ACYTG0_19005, partial [Planctomycetota bacterium]